MNKKQNVKFGKSGNRSCPFEVRWSEGGILKRKRFSKKLDAKMFFEKVSSEENLPEELTFSVSERICFNQIRKICVDAGVDLSKVVELVKDRIFTLSVEGKNWNEAKDEYLIDLKRRNARETSIIGVKKKLARFERFYLPENVAKIPVEIVEKFFGSISSPEHYKRILRAFLNFCIAKKWATENPFILANLPTMLKEKSSVNVMSVEDARNLIHSVSDKWRPAVVIMMFAGVRPSEILPNKEKVSVVRWEDVDFDKKRIVISSSVAKTRKDRILHDLPDNLWVWLKGCEKKTGNIAETYDSWRKEKKRKGIRLGKDILRHSFASYAYHFLGAERSVEILGHIGGFKVFSDNYKGLATPTDSNEYFNIFPK